MFFDKDKVIKSLTLLIKQKNVKIKKLTKKRYDSYGNGKYLILDFDGLDPDQSDIEDDIDFGGINFWYRTYDPSGKFIGYGIVPPRMVRSGSKTPSLFSSDNKLACVNDCEFTYSQLMKFFSYCLHRTYYPKIRYYQAKLGTVPALPVLKKFNLKE